MPGKMCTLPLTTETGTQYSSLVNRHCSVSGLDWSNGRVTARSLARRADESLSQENSGGSSRGVESLFICSKALG